MAEKNEVTVSGDYLRSIEKKVEDLSLLIEVSAIISSKLDFNDLMSIIMEKAKKIMNAEACSILLYNKEIDKLEFEVALCREDEAGQILKETVTLGIGEGIAGWVALNRKPLLIEDVSKDSRFSTKADGATGFKTASLIAVPLIGRRGLIGVAEILNPQDKSHFDEYDLEIFQWLSRQVGIAIENSLFYNESIEREKLKQELELASALQRSFLPESPIFRKGIVTATALNIPAKRVGGDLYDFVEPGEDSAGIFLGDISGKGISAALYMAKLISDFRYLSYQVRSPDILLNRLNDIMLKAPRGIFLTAIYMIVDSDGATARLSVAGHPPFILLKKDGLKVMDPPAGPPLGIMPFEYPVSDLSLGSGDRLLLLTDGLFDAKDKKGARIGFDGLISFIEEHAADKSLIESVVGYVKTFSEGAEQADDLSLVELKFD
jgi:sigma-B regulation protein RsbU (phosphoserine phosphatase)